MIHRAIATAVLVFAFAFIASACSSGGEGGSHQASGTVQLSGTISSQSMKPGLEKISMAAEITAPTGVWAMPVIKTRGANIDSLSFRLRKAAALDSNGDFSFDLSRKISIEEIKKVDTNIGDKFPAGTTFDVDWMVVTMSGATPQNVIELQGDAGYDGMVSIPLSAFTPDRMALGTVNDGNGGASLKVRDIEKDVKLSTESLAASARADDILKRVKDIIRNCDSESNKCISAEQAFVFSGVYSAVTHSTDFNKGSSYAGYQFYFDLMDKYSKADFDGICPGEGGTVTVEYTLTPPGAITVEGKPYGTQTPLGTGSTEVGAVSDMNGGEETECSKYGLPLYLRKDNVSDGWNLQFITGESAAQLTTDTPSGDWVLSRKGDGESSFTEIGRFEFALGNPVDASGNPIVFVPAIRFDTDGTDKQGLTTLHIKWFQHNGTEFVEITDASLLENLLGRFELELADFSGKTGDNNRRSANAELKFDTNTINVSNLDGNGKFYYVDSAEDYHLEYFGIGYQYGGQNFRFAWRW